MFCWLVIKSRESTGQAADPTCLYIHCHPGQGATPAPLPLPPPLKSFWWKLPLHIYPLSPLWTSCGLNCLGMWEPSKRPSPAVELSCSEAQRSIHWHKSLPPCFDRWAHLCEKILGAVPVFPELGQPMCCKMGPSLMYATYSQYLLLTAPPVPWGMPGLKVQYLLDPQGEISAPEPRWYWLSFYLVILGWGVWNCGDLFNRLPPYYRKLLVENTGSCWPQHLVLPVSEHLHSRHPRVLSSSSPSKGPLGYHHHSFAGWICVIGII